MPSGETLTVEVGEGGELLETGEGVVHYPKPDWQPSVVKQYMSVLPQNPYWEQQEPKIEPMQVWPLEKAQSPFSETCRPAVDVLAAEEEVDVPAQEVTKSVTTVVAVTPPVTVSVIVGSTTVGAGRVNVVVDM